MDVGISGTEDESERGSLVSPEPEKTESQEVDGHTHPQTQGN